MKKKKLPFNNEMGMGIGFIESEKNEWNFALISQ